MIDEITLEYDAFLRSIKRNIDTPHSFFLGAGASISSDIQSASDCIWEWKKDIYLSKNNNASDFYNNYKSESVKKSIQKWLDDQMEFPEINSPEEYSFYAEKAYPIDEDRRKYFMNLISEKKPYIGYKLMCLLAEYGIVKCVWTTNFDGLINRAAYQHNLTPIDINLDNPSFILRTESSKELPIVSLHGDYKYKTLKNTEKELDNQNEIFNSHLANYHVNKSMIVIGYSGRDKSLMKSLDQAFCKSGSGRLYWCGFGEETSIEVANLIKAIRNSGREAFYVPTDGFDKTLMHLSKAVFETNGAALKKMQNILEVSKNKELLKTEFKLHINKTDKYIKSNLHPISFPKEVFQFEIDYNNIGPWSFLRSKTKDCEICAVPFNKKVYAFGTLSEINKVFKGSIKTDIRREPIYKQNVENVGVFRELMLKVVIQYFTTLKGIEGNGKNKLWLINNYAQKGRTKIHKSIFLSLYFDNNENYAYLALTPTVHLTSYDPITKEQIQKITKSELENLYNDKYDNLLNKWNSILFTKDRIKFDYPFNSGMGFEFHITSKTAYAELEVLNKNFSSSKPSNYHAKQTMFKGIQLLEPQLIFKSKNSITDSRDYHPMRGLLKNRPYDADLSGVLYDDTISLSVICPRKYSTHLFGFLNGFNQIHKTENINPEYLIDFPGFLKAFNSSLNIPYTDDSEKWINIDSDMISNLDDKDKSLKLARLITAKIEQINISQINSTIVIFIPKEWKRYESYFYKGEYFDLHDYIKSYSASKGITTQLIREETIRSPLKCQIYWWLSLSFYVKALRTPWILNSQNQNTAFAGIGYSVTKTDNNAKIVVGCSHLYNSNGEGLKYRLSKVDDFYLDKQSNPFLSYNDAFQFGVTIRELFYQSLDKLPERVVIHKRTHFTENEINGIRSSLNKAGIKRVDLIEINFERNAKFLATFINNNHELSVDRFPVSRGTCIVTDKYSALLWTHGIVPSVRNPNFKYYLGGKSIPVPLKIIKHYGDSDISTIATEIIGLTKMNWNSFDLYTKLPATIDSSNKIAKIGRLLSRHEGRTYDYRLFI